MAVWFALVGCGSTEGAPPIEPCGAGRVEDSVLGCVPTECGTEPWAEVADGAVYVDASAAGGDGSLSEPFVDIGSGVERAAELGGARVLVAAGTYAESLVLDERHDGVEVVGRCAEWVCIDGTGSGESGGVIDVLARTRDSLGFRGLTLSGGSAFGFRVREGQVTLERAVVTDNALISVLADGLSTELTLDEVLISDSRTDEDGFFGYGLQARDGATLRASAVRLEANAGVAVFALDADTVVSLVDSEAIDTRPDPSGSYGFGLTVTAGARIDVDATTIARNVGAAVLAGGSGAIVTLNGCLLLDTAPDRNGNKGVGVDASDGAIVTLAGSRIEGSTGWGLVLSGGDTLVSLTDVSITGTLAERGIENGFGILAQGGARLTGSDVELAGNMGAGLVVTGRNTTVELDGLSVVDTKEWTDGTSGFGIDVSDGGHLALRTGVVARNQGLGLKVREHDTVATLDGVRIEHTRSNASGLLGHGVEVEEGATLVASGCSLLANHAVGLVVADPGSSVVYTGGVIEGTLPDAQDSFGYGIQVNTGATLQLADTEIAENYRAGVLVTGEGTRVEMQATTIRDTACGVDGSGGVGLEVREGAVLTAWDTVLSGNRGASVLVSSEGTRTELHDVIVRDGRRSASYQMAMGLVIQKGAVLLAEDVAVQDIEGPGFLTLSAGELTCTRCTVSATSFAGAAVVDGQMTLLDSDIRDTTPDASMGAGVGVLAWAFSAERSTAMTLRDTGISTQRTAAVWLDGAGSYDIEGSDLAGGAGVELREGLLVHGDGVFAANGIGQWDGATGLRLVDNRISGAAGAGLFLHAASATIEGNTFEDNVIDLWQQRCDGVATPDSLDGVGSVELCPEVERLILPIEFALELEDSQVEEG